MNHVASLLLGLSALTAVTFGTGIAQADVPPMCSAFDDAVNCDKADLDKACPSGGKCVAVTCELNGHDQSDSLYKCMTCPLVIEDTTTVCDGPAKIGLACGDGGTCSKQPSWCSWGKFFECAKPGVSEPNGEAGTGGGEAGSAGAAGSGTAGSAAAGTAGSATAGSSGEPASNDESSGGCTVSPVQRRGALAGVITVLGMAALMFERRRRG